MHAGPLILACLHAATGYAVDVKYSYHCRARSSWVEESSSVKVGVRTQMSGAKPLSLPPLTLLYSSKFQAPPMAADVCAVSHL